MSAAWPPRASTSGSPRSPARRRWPGGRSSSANAAAPIRPLPIVSCRSRVEPHSSFESLAWISCSRSGPDRRHQGVQGRRHPARGGQVVPGRPGVAGVEADAQPRVVLDRRQVRARGPAPSTPGCGRRPRSARPAASGRPCGGRPVEQRQQRLAELVHRLVVVRRVDRAAGVEDHRRSPRSPRRARSACASVSTERSTVSSVGEPRFTSSDAWM